MTIDWDERGIETPRFSPSFIGGHLQFIADLQKTFFTKYLPTVKERLKKYESWGTIIRPS